MSLKSLEKEIQYSYASYEEKRKKYSNNKSLLQKKKQNKRTLQNYIPISSFGYSFNLFFEAIVMARIGESHVK